MAHTQGGRIPGTSCAAQQSRRLRKRCDLHVDTAFADIQRRVGSEHGDTAFADTQRRIGSDHVDVTHCLAVAFPYGHGGPAARPSYATGDDLACGRGRLVLSAQQ